MKRVKITRPAKPKGEQLPGTTFYIRHDRFFTLLGSVIIFVTFVAKEGVAEKLKDSVSSMEAAESLSILRRDIAFGQTNGKPLPNPQPGRDPTRQESLDDIEVWKLEGQSLAELAGYQAMSLPDSEDLVKRARGLLGRFDEIERRYRKLNFPSKPPYKETYFEGDIGQLYKDAMNAYSLASDFRDEVFLKARKLKDERGLNYTIWRRASYFLFALGWALTFYGQLSGKPAGKPE
jgi:hypothetical protein